MTCDVCGRRATSFDTFGGTRWGYYFARELLCFGCSLWAQGFGIMPHLTLESGIGES